MSSEGWHTPGYVWIEGEHFITVAKGAPPPSLSKQAEATINAQHCAVLPGLVNGHTHFSQTLMRGLAGGRPLLPWLKTLIWPLQAALTPEDMEIAALLGMVENLRCGVTEVVDHHKVTPSPAYTDVVCKAAADLGMRVTVARAWSDMGKAAEAPADILADLERLCAQWATHSMVTIANGPLALWRCSAETLQQSHALVQRYGARTHVHVAETHDEVQMSLDAYDLRPVAWLEHIGVLDTSVDVVHAVWVNDVEIASLAARGAKVVHCPISNAVLGSGIARLDKMLRAGVVLRLGSDGPASNDTQDMFETLKAAVSFARASSQDATLLPPAEALRLATGGKVITPDAPADCIIVNLNHARAMPVHDPASALVLSTHSSDVQTVIINGQIKMRDGHMCGLDEAGLLAAARDRVEYLRQRAFGLES